MFEAKITIETPGLSQAINRLADAMAYPAAHATPLTVQPAPVTPPAPAPDAPAAVPVASPAPPVSTVPPTAATPPVTPPLAPAPSYTLTDIKRAGAELMTVNPGKYPELEALCGQFGISVLDQLRPEQYGTFATALRGLGAKL